MNGEIVKEEERRFFENLEKRYERLATQDNLARLRAKAWDRLQSVGLPSKKDAIFRPIRIRSLLTHPLLENASVVIDAHEVEKHLLKDIKHAFVFVNGAYQPSLSKLEGLPASLVMDSLEGAMGQFSTLLHQTFGKKIDRESNPFSLINTACQKEGLFLYLPPKMAIDFPIQVLHLVTPTEPHLLMPSFYLFMGALAELTLECHTVYLGEAETFVNGVVDIVLEEGAKLHLTETVAGAPSQAIHFQALRCVCKANSSLKGVFLTDGSKICRAAFQVDLEGKGAEAELSGLWKLRDKKQAHVHVEMNHRAEHTRSMQLFKGVLHDESRSSFNGKIHVDQTAQKTEAYQLNNNLILSPEARADTKPNLTIFADDVKASHGATVGMLNEEECFYLLSRGLAKKQAETLLIQGFCQEIIQQVPYTSLQHMAKHW